MDSKQATEYSKVVKIIKENGGEISSTVHRKVFALITTLGAVQRCTQRVRKACKLDIPVVDVSFLTESVQKETFLDLNNFYLDLTNVKRELERREKAKDDHSDAAGKEETETTSDVSITSKHVRKIHLGCCCSCHDSEKASCSWCEKDH
mmetsp:Transcript_13390/g.15531  ORF Transcript_13390/g.15531 Transcript_13390/m.15531 type:complete len:149 (-) Transcript_13390:1003-1449(-)